MKTKLRPYLLNIATGMLTPLLWTCGCSSPPPVPTPPPEQATDMALVGAIRDSGVRAAIVSQHTLYPFHFVPDGDALNELGEDDLAVLASHFGLTGGGILNVHQGDVSDALYAARVRRVLVFFQSNGIDPARVQIRDGPPGGDGMDSAAVLRATNAAAHQNLYYPLAGNSGASSTPDSSNTPPSAGSTGGGQGGNPQ